MLASPLPYLGAASSNRLAWLLTRGVLIGLAIVAAGSRCREARAQEAPSIRVELIAAEGDDLYRAGRLADAVSRYDQASALAFVEGAAGRAFELSRTAAAVTRAMGDLLAAAERLRRLARGNVDHPDAPAAQRAAIACLASASREQPSAGAAYGESLVEFLELWPDDEHAGEVRWTLIQWRAAQRRWRDVIARFETMPPDDPALVAALPLYADALIGLGEQSRGGDAAAEHQQRVRDATERLQPIITGPTNEWPEAWRPVQRAVALALARAHMAHNPSGASYPYRLLAAAVSGPPRPDDRWRTDALPILVLAAMDAGERDEALRLMTDLPGEPSPAARQLVERLEADTLASALRNPAGAGAEGRALLELTNKLTVAEPPAWLVRGSAAGLLATGQGGAASKLLEPLADSERDGLGFARLYAATLATRPDEESLRHALRLWRDVEARSAPGAEDWRVARLARVETLVALARRDEAQKLMALTAALYPPPTDPGLAARQRGLARSLGVEE